MSLSPAKKQAIWVELNKRAMVQIGDADEILTNRDWRELREGNPQFTEAQLETHIREGLTGKVMLSWGGRVVAYSAALFKWQMDELVAAGDSVKAKFTLALMLQVQQTLESLEEQAERDSQLRGN